MADNERRENIDSEETEILDEASKEIEEQDNENLEEVQETSKSEETVSEGKSSTDSCEWDDDDELIVIETGDGAPLVSTVENAESYYVVNSHQCSFHGLSPSVVQLDDSLFRSINGSSSTETPENVQLPDTVTKLLTPYRSVVYLIGTAHFSESSQEDVRKTIQLLQPNVVVVELCRSRVDILKYDEEYLMRQSENLNLQKLKLSIKQVGFFAGIMQVLLLSMSAHITKQLGMAPGGEFRAAYQEARKVPNCQFRLGDRAIQITLGRAMAALSLWQKIKLAWQILTFREPISIEDVERCKQKDFLAEMLAEMTGDFPKLYEVFLKERDQYLARSLRLAAIPREVTDSDGGFHFEPTVIVGVVGIGHVEGIVDNWEKDIDVQELMRMPSQSVRTAYIKKFLKTAVVVFVAWGSYRILRWTGLTSYISAIKFSQF